jgi:putative transposase
MRVVCAELDVELVEFNDEADHVRLLVAYPKPGDLHPRPATQRSRGLRRAPRKHRRCVPARLRAHF